MTSRPDTEAVRRLAYQLWRQRRPSEGTAEGDWYRAEQMLMNDATLRDRDENDTPLQTQRKTDDTVKQSFPASDPPASHLPDVPPVNADAKWAAARAAEHSTAPRARPGHAAPGTPAKKAR